MSKPKPTSKVRSPKQRERFEVLLEEIQDTVNRVAEGHTVLDRKLDETRQELNTRLDETGQVLTTAITSLAIRMDRFDQTVGQLAARVDRLEQTMQQLSQAVIELRVELRKIADGLARLADHFEAHEKTHVS